MTEEELDAIFPLSEKMKITTESRERSALEQASRALAENNRVLESERDGWKYRAEAAESNLAAMTDKAGDEFERADAAEARANELQEILARKGHLPEFYEQIIQQRDAAQAQVVKLSSLLTEYMNTPIEREENWRQEFMYRVHVALSEAEQHVAQNKNLE